MKLRRLLVVGLVVAVLPLTACGPDKTQPAVGAPASADPTRRQDEVSGRDTCLAGTWHVDLQDLASQAASKLAAGSTGTSTGTITVAFAGSLTITYANTLTLTSKASNGSSTGVKNTYAGAAVSRDYKAADGKITGTMAANTVTLQTSIIAAGHTVAGTPGPLAGVLDLSKGVTNYTCSGISATLNNGTFAWKLRRA